MRLPVAGSPEFRDYANDLAKQLAIGPGAKTPEELLAQPSPSKAGSTLGEVKDDMFNRIREVFNVGRLVRFDGPCGGYFHNAGTVAGVLLQVEGVSKSFGGFVAVRDVIEGELENILTGKKSVKQGLDDAVAVGNEILREFAGLSK